MPHKDRSAQAGRFRRSCRTLVVMDAEEVDWVEVLRVRDRFESEVTVSFLEDHGIRVQTAGGSNWALPTISMTDLRLLVPRGDLERAQEVLRAMSSASAEVHPFRDAPPEPYDAPVAKRSPIFAVMLALLVPIGGGHFYARHGAAGTLLAGGILGGFLGGAMGMHFFVWGSGLLVLADVVGAPFAVRRANRGAIPSDGTQRVWALGAVVVAYVVARVVAIP
jgi:Putative prokaryotic signal transducing protein